MSPGPRQSAVGPQRTSPPLFRQRNNSNSSLHSERSHRFSSLDKNKHPTVIRATRIPSPDRKVRPSTGYRPHVKNIFTRPYHTPPDDETARVPTGIRSTSSPINHRNGQQTSIAKPYNIPRKPITAPPRLNVDDILPQPLPLQPRRLAASSQTPRPTTSQAPRAIPRPPTRRRPDTAGHDRPPHLRRSTPGIPISSPRLRRVETSIYMDTHAAHQNANFTPAATALGSLANALNVKRFSRPAHKRTDSMATVGTDGEERPGWDEFLTLPRDEGSYTKFPRFEGGRRSVMERLVGKVGGGGGRPGTAGKRLNVAGLPVGGGVDRKRSWWSWGKREKE